MNRRKRIWIKLLKNQKSTIITLLLFSLIFSVILSVQLVAQNVREIRNITNNMLQPIVILASSYTLQVNNETKDKEVVPLTNETVVLMETYEEVESVNYSYEIYAYNLMKKYKTELQEEVDDSTRIEIIGSEMGVSEISKIRGEILVSGFGFSESNIEHGEEVVIIHEKYAALNGLSVGDTLTIESKLFRKSDDLIKDVSALPLEWEETIPLTIVGIVSQSEDEPIQEKNEKDTYFQQRNIEYAKVENTYYVPNKLIEEMNSNKNSQLSAEDERNRKLQIPTIYIRLYSLESQLSFMGNVQKDLKFPWILLTSEEMASTIIQPLKYMDKLFGSSMIVSLILFFLVLLLLILYQIRERKSEFGLYLALGETKGEVLSIIFGEYLCLGLVSMFFSIIFMKVFENRLNDMIISNQLLNYVGEKRESVLQNFTLIESKTQDQLIDAFNSIATNGVSPMYIIYAVILFLIALSIAVGAMYVYIKKINVKKILMSH